MWCEGWGELFCGKNPITLGGETQYMSLAPLKPYVLVKTIYNTVKRYLKNSERYPVVVNAKLELLERNIYLTDSSSANFYSYRFAPPKMVCNSLSIS
ncbi:hypothetical protein J6590_095401 [Homalodisca vitripennis]|nr:hypothetical protein J6590_095401 [Homalodisca vitripennis]